MTASTSATNTPWPRAVVGGRYRLDPGRSSIGFRTSHLFGLAPVTGTMQVVEGELAINPAGPAVTLKVIADAASFSTGNDRRDKDLRSARFLHVTEYPQFVFQAGTLSHSQGGWALAGELIVRTVTQPMTLALVSIESTEQGFQARAHTRVDRYSFGVTAAKGLASRYLDVDVTASADLL